MTKADKMLEEVGFKKSTLKSFVSEEATIHFKTMRDEIEIQGFITMEQLKAINEKCKELGWIKGE